jgi:acyl carrier protein
MRQSSKWPSFLRESCCRKSERLGVLLRPKRPDFHTGEGMVNLQAMRTLEQTTNEILELATKQFNVADGFLRPEDDFYKKLGIDSLQALDMLSRLENHFHIELPDYEVQGVSNFKTLAERIQARL